MWLAICVVALSVMLQIQMTAARSSMHTWLAAEPVHLAVMACARYEILTFMCLCAGMCALLRLITLVWFEPFFDENCSDS